jgi:hypothetical protein
MQPSENSPQKETFNFPKWRNGRRGRRTGRRLVQKLRMLAIIKRQREDGNCGPLGPQFPLT